MVGWRSINWAQVNQGGNGASLVLIFPVLSSVNYHAVGLDSLRGLTGLGHRKFQCGGARSGLGDSSNIIS